MEFVILIFSKDGKDYQLSPPRDVSVFDWLVSLKVSPSQQTNKQTIFSFLHRVTHLDSKIRVRALPFVFTLANYFVLTISHANLSAFQFMSD